MRKYADYDFYVTEYHGTLSFEDFDRAVVPASAYIKKATLGRSEKSDCEELKYACCALCDEYKSIYLSVDEESGKAIKSENTDGYSVTYASEATDGTTKEELWSKKALALLRFYLPSWMMSSAVGVVRW